jgi:hypothetical protein
METAVFAKTLKVAHHSVRKEQFSKQRSHTELMLESFT